MPTVANTAAPVSDVLLNAVNPKKQAPTDSVQADTDKFMTLLVTQLKNQDPMSPLDNAQITSQLAQLSTVTGVNKLNTTLESLKSSYQSAENVQAAGMINHGVLSEGKNIGLADGKAIFGIDLGSPADKVDIVIKTAAGKEVDTIQLENQPVGTLPITWDGKTLPNGNYVFSVEARSGGKVLKDAMGLQFGVVASVSTGAGGVKLNVPTSGQLSMSDIKQIL